MYALGRISAILCLSIVFICACKTGTAASTPLTTISAQTGGKIVYGSVTGVTTQWAAMAKMLSMVHTNSGEKPQIGRVFQFTGTNSVGVFFTVTDHPDGNIPLAGMVIATATGPNQVEAAMVYDLASRFGQTVNPMLQQLSGVWHPGAGSPAAGTAPASAGNGGSGAVVPPMRQVSLPDGTGTLSLPRRTATSCPARAAWDKRASVVLMARRWASIFISTPMNTNNPTVQSSLRRGLGFHGVPYSSGQHRYDEVLYPDLSVDSHLDGPGSGPDEGGQRPGRVWFTRTMRHCYWPD